MYDDILLCPTCDSEDIECVSDVASLYRCLVCNDHFCEDELLDSRDRTSRNKTKPTDEY